MHRQFVKMARFPERDIATTVDVTPILESLNDAQRQAVTAPAEPMLVIAGAGSGKTRVLVHRAAWLIDVERLSPNSLLAVTFTNKAAAEMRGRIESLLNMPVSHLWIGTFHGLAHRLLRRHWREAGLPQNFQIIDSDVDIFCFPSSCFADGLCDGLCSLHSPLLEA